MHYVKRSGRVLLVEDSKLYQAKIVDILVDLGYNVIGVCSNGIDALKQAEKDKPDIILMDIVLEGDLDGIETSSIIRNEYRIPVVFLTAHADKSFFEKAKISNPYGYIIKSNTSPGEIEINIEIALNISRLNKLLREKENHFKLITDYVDEAIWIKDLGTNKIEYISNSIEKITGYSAEEFYKDGDLLEKLVIGSKQRERVTSESHENSYITEYQIKNKFGSKVTVEENVTFTTSYYPKLKSLQVGITKDVTEKKKRDEERLNKELAERENKLKDQFIANVSHEIRTPLNGIMGMTQVLIDTPGLSKDLKEKLQIVQNSGVSLTGILNSVIDISRVSSNTVKVQKRVFSVHNLIEESVALFTPSAEDHGTKLLCVIDEKVPKLLKDDDHKIKQILNNLISNAIKYTENGTVEIGLKLLKKTAKKCQYTIYVKDSGIGITKRDLDRVFEKFFRTQDSINQVVDGAGLGLSVVKDYVKLLGGEIFVESKPKKGTHFSFNLESDFTVSDQKDDQEGKGKDEVFNHKILLVEDKKVNQTVAKLILTGMGCTVSIANHGLEAVKSFDPSEFDLILMDLRMPVMDGPTAIKEMNKLGKELPPIYALTADVFADPEKKSIELGVVSILNKPIDKKLIRKVLSEVPVK